MSETSPLLYRSPTRLSTRVRPEMNCPSQSDPASVPTSPPAPILLDALDHRQDEVLRQLEDLDEQIVQLVASCQRRSADRPV